MKITKKFEKKNAAKATPRTNGALRTRPPIGLPSYDTRLELLPELLALQGRRALRQRTSASVVFSSRAEITSRISLNTRRSRFSLSTGVGS